MCDRLKDKVALVSGAGSSGSGWGNGKATAVLFAREGAKVLAADINRDATLETKRIIEGEGGICEAISADVSRASDVAAMISACIAAFGRIDVLHNNVGIVGVGGPVETTEESWDRVNDVNLKSMFLTCKQVLPHMERQGNGAIVNASNKIRLGNSAVTVVEGPPYSTVSDKTKKENFKPVDAQEVLRKIRGLSVTSWNYIGHDAKQFRHYGPVAQDFFALFGDDGVGTIGSPTTITSTDMNGVLLLAVQALGQENDAVKAENAERKARIEALERLVKGMSPKVEQ